MALIKCVECGATVSSDVVRCPQCGKKLRMAPLLKFALWSVGVVVFLVVGLAESGDKAKYKAERLREHKDKCEQAMLASYGTSTRNYADKAAYEKRVEEDCADYREDLRDQKR